MRLLATLFIAVPACAFAQTAPLVDASDCSADFSRAGLFDDQPVSRFKKQAIQKISVSSGWLEGIDDDLSSTFFAASIGLGVPLGSFDNILGVSPSFRVDWIDAVDGLDVPAELFETGVQFFYRKSLSERWSAMAIVRPAVRSDFTTSDNALRIFGLGLLTKEIAPERLSMSFGAVYLDRADLPLLPALGLTWTPRRTTRVELRFPKSRLAERIRKNGSQSERWAYLSGELGGNTWAVTRASGRSDELSLRDFRIAGGVETIVDGGGGWFAEAGFAFGRRIEYESGGETSLSNAVLLQAGWSY